jgi:hypothetical protein
MLEYEIIRLLTLCLSWVWQVAGQSPVSVHIMCNACIQTSESILCHARGSSPSGVCRCVSYDKHDVNNAVILYLPFYMFYNFNVLKYTNTWHCTSQRYWCLCSICILCTFCSPIMFICWWMWLFVRIMHGMNIIKFTRLDIFKHIFGFEHFLLF